MPAWRDPVERFWSKVDPDGPVPPGRPDLGPCWVWTGSIDHDGYGRFNAGQRTTVGAHDWAYERYVAPVPIGLTLDHLCRNRACVRPDHLEAVTRVENVMRGESPFAQKARQQACARGHLFTPESTIVYVRRACRTCKRLRGRRTDREAPVQIIVKAKPRVGRRGDLQWRKVVKAHAVAAEPDRRGQTACGFPIADASTGWGSPTPGHLADVSCRRCRRALGEVAA